MKIAIVEDNEKMRKQLNMLIENTSLKYKLHPSIDLFKDGYDFINTFDDTYDLVYLDVEMPKLNGMDTAKEIRSMNSNVPIVFVTNFVQYAVEGYSVEAFDFILKPINEFNFENHFSKFMNKYEQNDNAPILSIKYKNEVTKLSSSDLLFVESEGHYLHYYTNDTKYTSIDTLKEIEHMLSNHGFFRCNNHYLVNLNYVSSVKDDIAIVGEHELKISRPRKKNFMAALAQHLGGI